MVLWSLGRSTSFQTHISVKPLNFSWEAVSHFLLSSEFNTSWYEFGVSWNIFINIVLMLSPEGWSWWANHSFVAWREYHGLGGSGIAGPWPDPGGCTPCGTAGGAMGGFRWVCFCDLNADRPGLSGLEGGWAGVTISSPELSDSLSDSEIGGAFKDTQFNFVNFTSFTGNRVSSNFTSQEILKCWWAASQNWDRKSVV